MGIDKLLSEGWQNHDSKSEEVAANLAAVELSELKLDQAGPFLKLSNHVIGEHLANWSRARTLAELVFDSMDEYNSLLFSPLAAARFLDGDAAGAQQAELRCVGAAGDNPMATYIEMKSQLAAALVGSNRLQEGAVVFEAVVLLADQFEEAMPSDRAIAITSNNIASDLLQATSHSVDQNVMMQSCAETAHKYWAKCGTWVNVERAYYLLALVANAQAEYKNAVEYTTAALKTIQDNGEDPIDEAFIRLAAVRALQQLKQVDECQIELEKADALVAIWEDEALRHEYYQDRAKLVG